MSRASGIGSWPDTDVRQAVTAVRDLLSEDGLPYLPELPARGPGADMIGRAAGLLADLAVDLQPMGWRFVDRPGHDAHRTSGLLREDLDELAEAFDGYESDLKVQIAGPWTLASSIWLHRGERSVVDAGATRDVIASLAEGLRVHLGEVAQLVPKANLVVQIDEPEPAVGPGGTACPQHRVSAGSARSTRPWRPRDCVTWSRRPATGIPSCTAAHRTCRSCC